MFRKKTSKSVAKDRLKFILINDRVNCSPEILERMRQDIIEVINRYMEVDESGIEFNLGTTKSEHSNKQVPALYANVPIKKMRGNKF
jgi:cell division topological specificity factor